jgi:hypothetical protein
MRGAIPPLPQYVFMASCLIKHRDNFVPFTCIILDLVFIDIECFESKVLRRIFETKRIGNNNGENYLTRTSSLHQILFSMVK